MEIQRTAALLLSFRPGKKLPFRLRPRGEKRCEYRLPYPPATAGSYISTFDVSARLTAGIATEEDMLEAAWFIELILLLDPREQRAREKHPRGASRGRPSLGERERTTAAGWIVHKVDSIADFYAEHGVKASHAAALAAYAQEEKIGDASARRRFYDAVIAMRSVHAEFAVEVRRLCDVGRPEGEALRSSENIIRLAVPRSQWSTFMLRCAYARGKRHS